jgi:hypothetical protein
LANVEFVRRLFILVLPVMLLASAASAAPVSSRVLKVLPHFLDLQGRHALSPSLYDRDAYQAQLRQHPEQRSAVRFDVLWKSKTTGNTAVKLRVELRGVAEGNAPRQTTMEKEVKPGALARWSSLALAGDDYKSFGEITAWRVCLWDGDRLIGEQRSFLW